MEIPRHVAIIMDGNRRWARAHRLPAIEGHRRGVIALREVTRAASDLGIAYLTVYGFSTENWNRDAGEISLLFELCVRFSRGELPELRRNNVRVRVIGRPEALPPAAREALAALEAGTAHCTGLQLNLAVNYSARAELREAVTAIARDVRDGRLDPDAVDEARVAAYLQTSGIPDPDLLLRPGGEWRVSNFLLWQVAHAEVVVSPTHWPDFDRAAFGAALDEYRRRTAVPA